MNLSILLSLLQIIGYFMWYQVGKRVGENKTYTKAWLEGFNECKEVDNECIAIYRGLLEKERTKNEGNK